MNTCKPERPILMNLMLLKTFQNKTGSGIQISAR